MLRLSSIRLVALSVVTPFLLQACGGDGGTDPDPDPDPDPSISMSVGASSVSIEQGQDGSVTLSITRSGGFTGAVTVTASGLPSGVTAAPATIAGGATSGTMTFMAASDAGPGSTDVTLNATGQGVSASATLEIEVTEAPTGSFSLALDPTSVTIEETTSLSLAVGDGPATAPDATVTVQITRESPFDGPVELAITDVPDDLQASLASSTVTGTETSLTVESSVGLAPGSYSVTVTGTADGVADQTATLAVTVEASSGGGGPLTVEICDASWFAFKDGDDPWARVMPGGDGDDYTFDPASDRVGIAWVQVTPTPGGFGEVTNVEVNFFGRDRVQGFQDTCETVSGGKTITGTVTGFGGTEVATVSLGFVSAFAAPGLADFTLEDVPDGPLDLMAVGTSEGPGTGETTASRMILRRDQDLADGTDLTLDLGGTEAFDLAEADVTLAGLGAGDHLFSVAFQSLGAFFTGGLGTRVNPTSPVTVPVVPADQRDSGDLHALLLSQEDRGVYRYAADPDGATIELGPPMAPVTVSQTTTGSGVFPSVTFTPQVEYDEWYMATFSQVFGGGLSGIDVSVLATDAWLDGGDPELAVPDFGTVDGWDTSWNLMTGLEITWDASALKGLLGFIFPENGSTLRFGTAEGSINP